MEELIDSHRRSGHRPEVNHLVTGGIGIELHTYRILHPGIRHQNPPGGDSSTKSRKPGRSQVETFAYLVPTEEHHSNERGFHKECQNTFDSKRRTEDVAHEPTVITPVRTEFKLQNQSRCHTYGKVDAEEFHPELGSMFPELVTRTVVHRFHDAHNYRQS